jgi:uncharacterized protein YjbJ (UPF0337 family)
MNIDTVVGEGTDLKGRFKESLGEATGDPGLQQDGLADQFSGNLRKAFGSVRDFARDKPIAALGLAGLAALALFGSSRGARNRHR